MKLTLIFFFYLINITLLSQPGINLHFRFEQSYNLQKVLKPEHTNYQRKTLKLSFSEKFQDSNHYKLFLSIGLGIKITGSEYVIASGLTQEFFKNIKFYLGFNLFFLNDNSTPAFVILIACYYSIALTNKSSIDTGPGFLYIKKHPVFTPSIKYETNINHGLKLGFEFLLPVSKGSEFSPLPFMMLNLSKIL